MNPDTLEEFTPEWFDACSHAWMLNKKRCGASYVYVCDKPKCKNKVFSSASTLCRFHAEKEKEERLLASKEKEKETIRRSPRLAEKTSK